MSQRGYRHSVQFSDQFALLFQEMMTNVCSCFSCSRYRSWDRIYVLKKNKRSSESGISNIVTKSSEITETSIDRLPDEVLIRILEYISPNNINNFLTLIGLEMVSKRLRHCMVKTSKKIWGNVTELVLGFHPNLPDTQYLCHIGHFTLVPFLQRVPKITKVIVNIANNWICPEMLENRISHVIGCSAGILGNELKFIEIDVKLSEQEIYKCASNTLIVALLRCAKESLETCQFTASGRAENLFFINSFLIGCLSLKHLKVSLCDWIDFSLDAIYILACSLEPSESVQSLEISGLPQVFVATLIIGLEKKFVSSRLQTLRLTNPQMKSVHSEPMTFWTISTILAGPNFQSIREFELHYCAHSDDLSDLPFVLENTHLDHLKLTFHPYFEFDKVTEIEELVENTQVNNKEMKISITFLHSDVDEEAKLAIIHHLLITFDVLIVAEQEERIWEFIRGKVTVNLKLEKIQDESLVCHRQPPPQNQ